MVIDHSGTVFFAVNLALMLFSCIGSAYKSTIIIANGSGSVLFSLNHSHQGIDTISFVMTLCLARLLTALSSIMCSRIFFSMHQFASQNQIIINGANGTSMNAGVVTTAQFAIHMTTFSDGSTVPGTHVSFEPLHEAPSGPGDKETQEDSVVTYV
jgi:ABC-type Fe3+-siderophore transport system permease subunit